MSGYSNIRQLLPANVYQAALNSHTPSSSNPFATISDLTSIGGGSVITASNGQVIYKNNSGAFVGSNGLLFNGTSLEVANIIASNSGDRAANKVFATNGTIFDTSTISGGRNKYN